MENWQQLYQSEREHLHNKTQQSHTTTVETNSQHDCTKLIAIDLLSLLYSFSSLVRLIYHMDIIRKITTLLHASPISTRFSPDKVEKATCENVSLDMNRKGAKIRCLP